MEKSLKLLFDFQKFEGNEKLQNLIDDVGKSQKELTLDELDMVNAAGECFNDKRYNKPMDDKNSII